MGFGRGCTRAERGELDFPDNALRPAKRGPINGYLIV